MKWVLVLALLDTQFPIYVFSSPTYSTKEQCLQQMQDPNRVLKIQRYIFLEYDRVVPIVSYSCITELESKDFLNGTLVVYRSYHTNRSRDVSL